MPGFTFPPVGPLGLGSPPSRPSHFLGRRYYDPLRLPRLPLGSLRLTLDPRYLAFSRFRSYRFPGAGVHPSAPGRFCMPVCLSRCRRKEMAVLSSAQATPVRACPVRGLRWCPLDSPWRLLDSCLPVQSDRQLSPARTGLSSWTTTMKLSELSHAAYSLATPGFTHTLTGYACRLTTDSAAHLFWWDLHG